METLAAASDAARGGTGVLSAASLAVVSAVLDEDEEDQKEQASVATRKSIGIVGNPSGKRKAAAGHRTAESASNMDAARTERLYRMF